MKYTFDTTARVLTLPTETYPPEIAAQWNEIQGKLRVDLIYKFGVVEHERKLEDFTALGADAWSIIALHNRFLQHARVSFIAGAYYASLVASCALGERILNQLFVTLRADFPPTADTYRRESFDDWAPAIKLLREWGVIDDATRREYKKLGELRNKALHFDPRLPLDGTDAREEALTAYQLIRTIVEYLFTPIGGPPRFIDGIEGQSFIALDQEKEPLIRRFSIPVCVLVSPNHICKSQPDGSDETYDDETYQDRFATLTDSEFATHLKNPSDSAQ
jgi:hypothetical protein